MGGLRSTDLKGVQHLSVVTNQTSLVTGIGQSLVSSSLKQVVAVVVHKLSYKKIAFKLNISSL